MPARASLSVHRLCVAVMAALALPAFAQDVASTAPEDDAQTLDRVTVTGSRIKRAEIEDSLPITAFSRA